MSRTVTVLTLLLLAGCAGPRPIEAARSDADFRYDHGEYEAAAAAYAEIIARYPGDWRANYMLGLCELELDRPGRARSALEVALTNRPGSPDVADALAEALFRSGDEAALFEFLVERAEAEQSVRAWLRLGRYAAESGDADSALTAFETAIMLDDGTNVEPYLVAASFAQRLGDVDEALRRLRQAYTIDPDDARVSERIEALGEVPGPTLAMPPGR